MASPFAFLRWAMCGLVLSLLQMMPANARGGATEVDVELVLAVDISYSMDTEEQRLQRQGTCQLQLATAPQRMRHGSLLWPCA